MGKYMRKDKVSGEVAVMEVSGALLGVRTRSRTLALQRMQRPPGKGEEEPEPEPEAPDYLELRSRRLEKPHPPPPKEKEAPAARRKTAAAAAAEEFEAELEEAELEVSFGDNVLDLDAMERSTRETTPCSLIKNSETISTPGSTTRISYSMSTHRRMETPICRYIPRSIEMEEFFAAAEQQQQQTFREKYNFCPVNDCPLPGRYGWARLDC